MLEGMNGPYLVVCWGKGRIFECYFHLTGKAAAARVSQWEALGLGHTAKFYDLPSLLSGHEKRVQAEVADLQRMYDEEK